MSTVNFHANISHLSCAHVLYLFTNTQNFGGKCTNLHNSLWMCWLLATERRANVIYIVLYLKMLILNNCSTFLGFWTSNCPRAGSQRDSLSARQITHVPGWAWERPGRWTQVKWHDKDRGTYSFRRRSGPLSQGLVSHSPLHRLPVREERPEASDALESQGAKAPVVDGHCVLLLLQQFWGLQWRRWKHTWAPARGGNQPF